MKSLPAADKKKVKAKIDAFDFSAFSRRLPSSFVKNYGSCVGRDFKLWAQVSVFILDGIISDDQLQVWFYLSNVRINKLCHAQVFIEESEHTDLLFTSSTWGICSNFISKI